MTKNLLFGVVVESVLAVRLNIVPSHTQEPDMADKKT